MTPELEELACLYVLDQLSRPERNAFETRLAGDPELARLVRDLETTVTQRIRLLPQQHPPADLLARIEARLDASPRRPQPSTIGWWAHFAGWSIAAAAAIALGVATFLFLEHRRAGDSPPLVLVVGLDPERSTVAEIPLPTAAAPTGNRFVQLASLAETLWTRADDRPPAAGVSAAHRAYALFDPDSHQGFIAVQRLPAQPDGKHYHLWLVDATSGRTIDAGILPAAPSRRLYFFSVDAAAERSPASLSFLVTAEDASPAAPARPHGEVILGRKPI